MEVKYEHNGSFVFLKYAVWGIFLYRSAKQLSTRIKLFIRGVEFFLLALHY